MRKNQPEFEHALWTPERIGRFWDLVADEPRLETAYFSRYWSSIIIEIAKLGGLRSGEVLDYGCGPGFLAEKLVESGYSTTALEFSPKSAERVERRVGQSPNWHGCVVAHSLPTPITSGSFDWIFSVETYEHLPEEWIPGYFDELTRILKPGGKVLITTPHEENINAQLIICPCCEAKFHRWGHLRRTSIHDLSRIAEAHGLAVDFCGNVSFDKMIDPAYLSYPLGPQGWPVYLLRRILLRAFRGNSQLRNLLKGKFSISNLPKGPNLVLIARRP